MPLKEQDFRSKVVFKIYCNIISILIEMIFQVLKIKALIRIYL